MIHTREEERNRVGDYVGCYATAASAAEVLSRACACAHTHTTRSNWFDQVGEERIHGPDGRGSSSEKKKEKKTPSG